MLACVILNYNDWTTVLNLVKKIKNYSTIKKIIIVDNKSTDDSFFQLKKIETDKIIVIQSSRNGGYGFGNNVGIRYAQDLGSDYVLVSNPDVLFTEESIINCLEIIKKNDNCAACAPKETNVFSVFKFEKPLRDIFCSSLLLNKFFKIRKYDKSYFENKDIAKVDAISGSLVLYDLEKFSECGLYDENVFLYHEEVIVGKKIQSKGFIQLLNLKDLFIHEHSVSVKKNIKSAFKTKKIVMDSHYYYLKQYCHANKFILLLQRISRFYCYLELFFWKKIKSFGK